MCTSLSVVDLQLSPKNTYLHLKAIVLPKYFKVLFAIYYAISPIIYSKNI